MARIIRNPNTAGVFQMFIKLLNTGAARDEPSGAVVHSETLKDFLKLMFYVFMMLGKYLNYNELSNALKLRQLLRQNYTCNCI